MDPRTGARRHGVGREVGSLDTALRSQSGSSLCLSASVRVWLSNLCRPADFETTHLLPNREHTEWRHLINSARHLEDCCALRFRKALDLCIGHATFDAKTAERRSTLSFGRGVRFPSDALAHRASRFAVAAATPSVHHAVAFFAAVIGVDFIPLEVE